MWGGEGRGGEGTEYKHSHLSDLSSEGRTEGAASSLTVHPTAFTEHPGAWGRREAAPSQPVGEQRGSRTGPRAERTPLALSTDDPVPASTVRWPASDPGRPLSWFALHVVSAWAPQPLVTPRPCANRRRLPRLLPPSCLRLRPVPHAPATPPSSQSLTAGWVSSSLGSWNWAVLNAFSLEPRRQHLPATDGGLLMRASFLLNLQACWPTCPGGS